MPAKFLPFAALLSISFVLPTAANSYPRSSFDSPNGGNLNISVFTFRDLNRNGVYDLGDLPMMGLIVDATGPTKSVRHRSNGSGFANFVMSASDPKQEIAVPGPYRFEVVVPDGWQVTTGNALQEAEFKLLSGAPADIYAVTPPTPVGLAPDLYIRGTVPPGVALVSATAPDGGRIDIEPKLDGSFSVPARPGTWTLIATGAEWRRTTTVESASVYVSAKGDERAQSGELSVAGFEGLVTAEIAKVPSGYAGVGWLNFVAAYNKFYESEGYRNNLMSGTFVGYNGSGQVASISNPEPFDFLGGYVGVATLRAEGETLYLTAWRGDELAYEDEVTLSALGPVYFQADYLGVTRIDVRTAHYWQATFDDLTFRAHP